MMSVPGWNLDKAVVFCRGNIEDAGRVLYLPWYMSMFMDSAKEDWQRVPLDIPKLP